MRLLRILIIAFLLLVSACSDTPNGSGFIPDSYSELDTEIAEDAEDDVPDYGDVPVAVCDEECQYQQECWDCAYYFCPPFNAVWQKRVCYDRCLDPPAVVFEGECEELFECDPVADTDYKLVECELPDGTLGKQEKWCNKGHYYYGPCNPCEPEVCDGVDNDCDYEIDEGTFPCDGPCGPGEAACVDGELTLCSSPEPEEEICNGIDDDCDGEVDEGQLNACGECGDVPEDICDGIDNDCDGQTDEDLVQACSTVCEDGYQLCLGGSWNACSAQQPYEEVCNGLDDDCDSLIDEDLDCGCPPETIGFLIPCMEEPLLCGQGYKTCQCANEDCTITSMSPCQAVCAWAPQVDPACDPTGGAPVPEVCNDFDDDCDVLVDEDLLTGCYSGDMDTLGVGICHGGEMICESGKWGNYPDNSDVFVDLYCLGEQLPLEEDLCSGQDDNCDGVIDKNLQETDILFIVDTSGSMTNTINAVQSAMSMFASTYADDEVIQWGIVVGPVEDGWKEMLKIETALVPFQQFLPHLNAVDASYSTGNEMLYDAVYLSILNLLDPADILMTPQSWDQNITSDPSLGSFKINWREDANHVVIVFTDEDGQSYLKPSVQKELIKDTAQKADELSIYTFSPASGKSDWEDISINGSWFSLTSNPSEMFDNLMQILDETACGESE